MNAEKYAILYGLKYEGRKRLGTRMQHVFTDLLTDNTLRVPSLNRLHLAVLANRSPGFSQLATEAARARALKLSEQFYGFKPRQVRRLDLEWPESLVSLGVAVRIDYVSDKFDGKPIRYAHEFERPTILYCDSESQPDGSNLLLILGKFTIEPEGITG